LPEEIIEVISPAGSEDFFGELCAIWPDRSKSAALLRKYELVMERDSVPGPCARFGLKSGCGVREEAREARKL